MQIIRRNRLGNDTEDITSFASLLTRVGPVAAIDGYDVLQIQTTPPLEPPIRLPLPAPLPGGGQVTAAQPVRGPIGRAAAKLFDVLGLAIKQAPRGIAYIPTKNLFVFSNDAEPAKLFLADRQGVAAGTIEVRFTQGLPVLVEGLGYIPATTPTIGDAVVLIATFADNNSPSEVQSRLEIVDFRGRVLQEIIPPPEVAQLFLTGVCFNTALKGIGGNFLVTSDDDNTIYQIDLKGGLVSKFTAPVKQAFSGIEGLVEFAPGELAVANGFAGMLEVFGENGVPLPQAIDYRIGPGLSLPNGLAWDSTTNEFLILALDRTKPDARFIARLAPALNTSQLAISVDASTRKVTYLPNEKLIAVGHGNNPDGIPRGILLFNEQGQSAGVIRTSQFSAKAPVILSYLPQTQEFGIVFADGPQNQLKRLKRDGTALNSPIDFAAAGIRKITAVTFFNPANSGNGQFLVFDNTQDLFVTTDFTGAKLSGPFSIRDTLRVLNPTAVTTITTGPDAGKFAICNGENSEVVVFTLG